MNSAQPKSQLIHKISHHLRQIEPDSDPAPLLVRMLITDSELEQPIKSLIKEEVHKSSEVKRQEDQYKPVQQSIAIRNNVKDHIQGLILKYLSKQQAVVSQSSNRDDQSSESSEESEQMPRASANQSSKRSFLGHTKTIVKGAKTERQPQKRFNPRSQGSESKRNAANRFKLSQTFKKTEFLNKEIVEPKEQDLSAEAIHMLGETEKEEGTITVRSVSSTKESVLHRRFPHLPQKDRPEEYSPELQKTMKMGHFVYGDKVKSVIDRYSHGPKKNDKVVLIEWEAREDGFKPQNSMMGLQEYKYYRPREASLQLREQSLNP